MKNITFTYLIYILTISKILISLLIGDTSYENEWEIINTNLINYGELSYYFINNQRIPSIYMPPLYSYFLYLFHFFNLEELYTVKLVLVVQCILSGITSIIFFNILKSFINVKTSFYISILYSIFPLNFYAATQISSVTLQIFLLVFFIYFFLNSKKYYEYILLGILSGLLILIRGEFWLLFLILICFKIYENKKMIIKFFIPLIISILVITPTLLNNYSKFDEIILTKSFGYNLWRGNSEKLNINGSNFAMDNKFINDFLDSGTDIKRFEIYLDDFFYKKAKKNILENPMIYLEHYLNKFFAFSIFNYSSNYPNYYNPFIFIPEIIISIFALGGIVLNITRRKNTELLIIIVYYLLLIPIFFVLPRYKLFILPLYFVFASDFYFYLRSIFSKKQ